MMVLGTALAALLLGPAPVLSENIDPDVDESQFAWAENVGWINAEPLGDGGPGVQVDDFQLTGWMWGENVGWISLSCRNTASCSVWEWGVKNDGSGHLSGFAWSENAGWINFAPGTDFVAVDAVSGRFMGHAWGENIGWITMSSAGPTPFGIRTSWNCAAPPPPPMDPPLLRVMRYGADQLLRWSAPAGATGYDVVEGDLYRLKRSGGDFTYATTGCPGNNLARPELRTTGTPSPGQGSWYLVRGLNCGGAGTYDSRSSSQVGLRDDEINASARACP